MNEQDPRAADRATILEAHAITVAAIGRAFSELGARSAAHYAGLFGALGACLQAAAAGIETEAAKAARAA